MHSHTYMSCYANLGVYLNLVGSFLEKHVAVRRMGISNFVPLTLFIYPGHRLYEWNVGIDTSYFSLYLLVQT